MIDVMMILSSALTFLIALRLTCVFADEHDSRLVFFANLIVLFPTVIVSIQTVIGFWGVLTPLGFLSSASAVLLFDFSARFRSISSDFRTCCCVMKDFGGLVKESRYASAVVVFLLMLFLALVFVALNVPAINYDSNTYRLTRIGLWMQEHRLYGFFTNDPRMIYMPLSVDLWMVWFLNFTDSGFAAAKLVQLYSFGGLLVFVVCFVRLFDQRRSVSLLAVLMVVSMANVSSQAITTQTDLATSFFFFASLYYLVRFHLRRKVGDVLLFGVLYGFAVSSKGTVLYFTPFIFIYVLWHGVHFCAIERCWRLAVWYLAGGFACVVIASPSYIMNYKTFGGFFGPPEEIASVVGEDSSFADRIAANSVGYFWQLFEPGSNISSIHFITDPVYDRIFQVIKEEHFGRRLSEFAQRGDKWVFSKRRISHDGASIGVICFLVFLFSSFLMPVIRRHDPVLFKMALWFWFVCVAGYLLFSWHQAYTPFKYRYFVLMAGPLAAVSALSLSRIFSSNLLKVFVVLFIILAGDVFVRRFVSPLDGLPVVYNLETHPRYPLLTRHKTIYEILPSEVDEIALLVPRNFFFAPFFSDREGVKILLLSDVNCSSDLSQLLRDNGIEYFLAYDPPVGISNELKIVKKCGRWVLLESNL